MTALMGPAISIQEVVKLFDGTFPLFCLVLLYYVVMTGHQLPFTSPLYKFRASTKKRALPMRQYVNFLLYPLSLFFSSLNEIV